MQTKSFENPGIADSDPTGIKLSKGLGWFSIGLGLVELLAPRKLSRFMGVADDGKAPWIVRAYGLRELAAGVMCLTAPASPVGPAMRLGGDALDIASLLFALPTSLSRPRTVNALALVAGATAADTYATVRHARRKLGKPVVRAVTINRSPAEVYDRFRRFERLPEFMTWIESVQELGEGKTHWVVNTPAGKIEYDAETIEDVPGRRIEWRSLAGATVPNRGCVTFLDAPGGRGTELIVELQVAAPLGKTLAGSEAQGDLHRLKQILETGEVLLSDATAYGKGPHPAQPDIRGGVR